MCGLTGIFTMGRDGSEDVLSSAVRGMADTLRHRGPDDEGIWVDAPAGVAFGFRRLSILDLSPLGHQPMESPSGRYVIAFNGEIYNFLALRSELEDAAGQGFRGRSDTEVLLRAIEHWGLDEAIRRCAGMFAFALWDRREQSLHLARDRMGEKPMYYGRAGAHFVFGSELKALRAHPDLAGDIDRDAVALFLKYGYIPAPHSIYRGIYKLPPGSIVSLTRGWTKLPLPRQYWSLADVPVGSYAGSDSEALEDLERLLRGVVAQEMISDVPLGAFLSGGVDSSLVVALMQSQSRRPVKTFTIGFAEQRYNEAKEAARVASHLGTDHTELYVTPAEALAVVPKLSSIYDEPFADSSQIPTFLVSELASRHVTVSLSGDGGDELFGGYVWYAHVAGIWRRTGWMPGAMRRALAGAIRGLSTDSWDRALGGLRPILPRAMRQIATGDRVHKFATVLARGDNPEETYDALLSRWDGTDVVLGATASAPSSASLRHSESLDVTERLMAVDLNRYLPDNILAKVDRASMAASLESRAPLLDHRVVEFAWRLPMPMKIRGGQGKWLARQLLYRHVPREIVDRPKMGFCVPIDQWLRGALRDWAEEELSERRVRNDGFLNPAAVRAKWQEHQSGKRNWQHHLWSALIFQAWLSAHRPAVPPAASLEEEPRCASYA
jgi:asparagine synthase (glutamine-hydrolysing)